MAISAAAFAAARASRSLASRWENTQPQKFWRYRWYCSESSAKCHLEYFSTLNVTPEMCKAENADGLHYSDATPDVMTRYSRGNEEEFGKSVKQLMDLNKEKKTVWNYLNPNVDYDEMTDERDGQVYKTVKIGNQIWMAENLNYASRASSILLDSSSFCYDNVADSCAMYGRLYLWNAALEACPEGWHLPDNDEWKVLLTSVASSVEDHENFWYYIGAGAKLKTTAVWESSNGVDGVRYGGSDRVRAGELENVQTPESFSFCNQCGAVKPKPEYKISELFYDVTTYPWYGTFQFINKKDLMTWGVGFGFDNALYVSGSAGFNTKHFEVGGTLTLGVMSVLQEREGLSLGCSKYNVCGLDGCEVSDKSLYGESYEKDEESSFSGIVSPGIYASAYWKQFSLTYSGSVYWPDNIFDEDPSGDFTSNIVKTKGDYLPAAVFTNHFSVGYIFDNGVGIRLGATSVFGEFEGWHWSGFGGLEINL